MTAEHVAPASDVLIGLGFQPLGQLGIPQRWAFKEPPRLSGTNTYVIVDESLSLRNRLRLRDTLRASSDLRRLYSSVKMRVGATAGSIEEYGQGKDAVIQQILAAAGLTDDERRVIDAAQVPSHEEVPPAACGDLGEAGETVGRAGFRAHEHGPAEDVRVATHLHPEQTHLGTAFGILVDVRSRRGMRVGWDLSGALLGQQLLHSLRCVVWCAGHGALTRCGAGPAERGRSKEDEMTTSPFMDRLAPLLVAGDVTGAWELLDSIEGDSAARRPGRL